MTLTLALIFITGMGVSLAGVYTTPGLIWVGVFTMLTAFSGAVVLRMDQAKKEGTES